MDRTLEIYPDGSVYEFADGQAVKVTETHGNVALLLRALQFSTAKTFAIAPPNAAPPSVPVPRGGRSINAAGLNLLTTYEGCKLKAYDDGRGVLTIGYGHTKTVKPGMTITQPQAEELLRQDLEEFETYVEDAVQVEINSDQFSALVCLAFNIGPNAFGDSTLLKRLNQSDYPDAANRFLQWNKVNGQPWLGLTRRRMSERSLFLSQPWELFRDYDKLEAKTPPIQGTFVRQVQEKLLNAGFIEIQVN
ncbi:MAG: lysozyme [Oculatellaceae cyanobacterium Prado106]|jgi:GH24 family phage-related lysozyme (muramidase)|nr:lysozyme [Oculatellaceae cyanobacterium Prado106]